MRIFVLAASAAGLFACVPVKFDVNSTTEDTMTVTLGDLSGTCSGEVTREDVTIVKTQTGDNCQLAIDFSSALVDMGEIRAKVEAKVKEEGHDLSDAEVKLKLPLTVAFRNVTLTGIPAPTFDSAWDLDLSLNDTSMVDQTGTSLATFFALAQSVDFTEDQVKVANDAYKNRLPVEVDGTVVLATVPVSYLASIPASSNAVLTFGLTVTTKAGVTVDAGSLF